VHEDLGVLEVKVLGVSNYADVKRNGIPQKYLLQGQHSNDVTARPWTDFAIFNAERWEPPLVLRVLEDKALTANLRDIEAHFWHEHVQKDVPPPVEGFTIDLPEVKDSTVVRLTDARGARSD
jgi:predicted phage-related endonuclease